MRFLIPAMVVEAAPVATEVRRPSFTRLAVLDRDQAFARGIAVEAERVGVRTIRLDADQVAPTELKAAKIDALLLDPDTVEDFWDCLERICREIPGLRVLVCAERSDLASRLRGLRTGAEDWITKPAAVAEVLARVEASCRPQRLRRSLRPDQLRAGELEIRPEMLEVIADGKRMDLTRREFELLHFLAIESERVLERDAIYRRVWGYSMPRGDRSVDTYVGRLRIKLDRVSPTWAYIHTHFGIGYRFEPRPTAEAAAPERPAA